MLVRREGACALVIGQLSHAWLAGQLARAWGNPHFGLVDWHEEVALGAEQHDIGWATFDLEPRLDADTGLPQSFLDTEVSDHLAIWSGAPDRLMSQSARAALIVSLHGSSLSALRARNDPAHADLLKAHVEEERERQARLCAALGVSAAQRERIRRQMWAWDALSLALCNAWTPFSLNDVPAAKGLDTIELISHEDGTATLDPWPFAADRVVVGCEARRLDGGCTDEAQMREALARARPVMLRFVLGRVTG